MRLLFDQNLSHRLIEGVADLFPDSQHVRLVGLAEAMDLSIWEYAKDANLVIVTQDSDYADWNKLRGAPPKIVWLRCGNASFDTVLSKLRNSSDRILHLSSNLDISIVEIW